MHGSWAACSWGVAALDWAALGQGSAEQSWRAKSRCGEGVAPQTGGGVREEHATDGDGGDGQPSCERARSAMETPEVLERCN